MNRLHYVIRRLILAIPTFLGITLVCFALTRILPGGPVEMRLQRMRGFSGGGEATGAAGRVTAVTEDQRRALNHQFGFDQPFFTQYVRWLVRDRMGLILPSYEYNNKTAWQMIRSRIPVSLWFGLWGFLLSYLLCIPLGILKALRHGSAFDISSSVLVFIGYAIPAFAFGMLLKTLFCGTVDGLWDVFPLGGFESAMLDPHASPTAHMVDRAWHMVLPVTCYVIGDFALLTLMMKNSLLDQIGSDYVRTVLAKGASARRAVWRHAVRNALIPIATGFGGILSVFFAGAVIIEMIFEIPGMGRLSLESLIGRDYAVFMAMLALTSTLQLFGNLLSDCCYLFIDPRIHFGK